MSLVITSVFVRITDGWDGRPKQAGYAVRVDLGNGAIMYLRRDTLSFVRHLRDAILFATEGEADAAHRHARDNYDFFFVSVAFPSREA